MASKRRTIVDSLRDARTALGSLPADNARALLRELTAAEERVYVRCTAKQKREWEAKAKAAGVLTRGGKPNVSEWLRGLADAQ